MRTVLDVPHERQQPLEGECRFAVPSDPRFCTRPAHERAAARSKTDCKTARQRC
jgi:hypothetical protein